MGHLGRQMRREGEQMPGPLRPTLRRIELGYELQRLRKAARLTREEAVRGLPLSDSRLLRIETGLHDLRSADLLKKLLVRYGVTEENDAVRELLRVQREASSQEWWAGYRSVMRSGMSRFMGIESAARAAQVYHPLLIPGLLQTEAYARALYEIAKPIDESTTEWIDRNVELRMGRKQTLHRDGDPLVLSAVIWEPAFRYVVGSPEVMRDQCDEIMNLARLDHVTIQVLPAKTRGYLGTHDFTILDLGDDLPTAVQVDAGGSPSVTDKPREVARFRRKFESMAKSALAPEDTPEFLHQLAREIIR
jgi:transcriptional regulator with XRE-family HTH domain